MRKREFHPNEWRDILGNKDLRKFEVNNKMAASALLQHAAKEASSIDVSNWDCTDISNWDCDVCANWCVGCRSTRRWLCKHCHNRQQMRQLSINTNN